jgi:undecaprenyl-diphosphatase
VYTPSRDEKAAILKDQGGGVDVTGINLVVLAVIQGITEFLPISSSAHLILVPVFTDWPDQGPMIDVAVHVGTLGAVLLYFRRDVWAMLQGLVRRGNNAHAPGTRLMFQVIVATVPVVIAGAALSLYGLEMLRSPALIGWTMLGFGLLLYAADTLNMTIRTVQHMTFFHALFIGVAQVLALVPGTSRAGITMTAARALGYERADAARFSMLLSMPTILAAGVLVGYKLYGVGDMELGLAAMIAAGLSFVAALATIGAMMAWLKRASFTPFVVYRVALGGYLLWWAYF